MEVRVKPTREELLNTRTTLLSLCSRRLIQFMNARNKALECLEPKQESGKPKKQPNIEEAISLLKDTLELR